MIDQALLEQISEQMIVEMEAFFKDHLERIQSQEFLSELESEIKQEAADAMESAGFDISKPFFKAVIACFKVVAISSPNYIEFKVEHGDFDNVELDQSYKLKNNETVDHSITSHELLQIIDQGRRAFTVESNQEHGFMAIPPPGQKYSPTNKDNKLVTGTVQIPEMRGSDLFDRVRERLEMYIKKREVDLLNEFSRGLKRIFRKYLK